MPSINLMLLRMLSWHTRQHWLQYYYPVEFMAATLNSFVGNSDKISYYVQECKQEGIEVRRRTSMKATSGLRW